MFRLAAQWLMLEPLAVPAYGRSADSCEGLGHPLVRP